MRLRQIEVFHAVYVTGSVSAAAQALNVSQPSVSKVLRHTEDTLGFSLFDRTKGRLYPTEKATILFEQVKPVYEKLADLRGFAARLAADQSEHLRFAMTPSFADELAPMAIAAFMKCRPSVTIDIQTLPGAQIAQAVLDGEIDVGLAFAAPHLPGLSIQTLARTNFLCAAPKDLVLKSHNGVLAVKEIEGYSLITLNEKSVPGLALGGLLSEAFESPVESRIVVETNFIAKRLVQQGAGLAIIDAITAQSGDNVGLAFYGLKPAAEIGIDVMTRQHRPPTGLQAAFIAELEAAVLALDDGQTPLS